MLNQDLPPLPCQILFLLGLMRSGTTFFRNLLSANPQIEVLGSELNRFWTGTGEAPCGLVPTCPALDAAAATPVIRERVRREFGRFHHRRNHPGRQMHRLYRKIRYGNESILKHGHPFYLLNKSTHLVNKVAYLRAIFPEARFIVLIRDIHGQVASMKKHLARITGQGYRAAYPGGGACWSFTMADVRPRMPDFETLPTAWIDMNLQLIESLQDLGCDEVCWLDYQTLCRNPLGTVAELDSFLGFTLTRDLDCKPVNASSHDPLTAWQQDLTAGEQKIIARVIAQRTKEYDRIIKQIEPQP